jgi:hypothetical protein
MEIATVYEGIKEKLQCIFVSPLSYGNKVFKPLYYRAAGWTPGLMV